MDISKDNVFAKFPKTDRNVNLVELNENPSGLQLINPYRTNKANSLDLVSLAREIQNADKFVHANVSNKLQVIAEQVRFLQEQAKRVLMEGKNSHDLHHISCNFVKKPGYTYYLYQRPSGQRYFSMLSPQEWGSNCPHRFEGAFRLEHDQSWTSSDQFDKKDYGQEELLKKILNCSNSLSITMGEDSLDY